MSRAPTQILTKESRFPWNDQWQSAVETELAAWSAKIPATCPAHGEPTGRKLTSEPCDYGGAAGHRTVRFSCQFEPCPICRVARAGFPPLHQRCSFENFTADTDELRANLAKAREFAADPKGLLLMLGRAGNGKTHLAASIVRAVGRGRYLRHLDLINRLRASYARPGRESDPEELPEDIAEACRNASLLVIDELGVASGGNDGDVAEARQHLHAWLGRWQAKYPKLCLWAEANIEETWTFYRQPREHHKHLKSTNLLERLNQELKRRTHVVRIFPHEASCLRLIRALACEQHEEWLDGPVYLDMQPLKDQLKPSLQLAA